MKFHERTRKTRVKNKKKGKNPVLAHWGCGRRRILRTGEVIDRQTWGKTTKGRGVDQGKKVFSGKRNAGKGKARGGE